MKRFFTTIELTTADQTGLAGIVDVSLLRQFATAFKIGNFSIKFVADGCEHYALNDNPYSVRTGEFLLANRHCEGRIDIDSPAEVRGICIDVPQALLSEVALTQLSPNSLEPKGGGDLFFDTPLFPENKYRAQGTQTGRMLLALDASIQRYGKPEIPLDYTFFYNLSECIVADHRMAVDGLQRLTSTKISTKKELYRRVLIGRDYIDAHYLENPSIRAIAREGALSEYHFFRSFRAVYGMPPHRYMLHKRLEHATALLAAGMCASDAAMDCGFADVHSFGKIFKKYTGKSPGRVIKL